MPVQAIAFKQEVLIVAQKRKRLILVALGLAALTAMAVAASGAFARTSSPGATHAAKLTHLDVGLALIPPKMTFVAFYVAKDKGFFAKNGLDVNLQGFDGGVKSLRGVASGSVDVGCTSADDVITAATQGGGVKAFWSYAMPLDTTLVADQSVQTIADLKGKKIGITDPGGFADVQVRAVLAQAHLSPSDAQIISLPNRAALLPALVSGRINAAPFHADDGYAAEEQDSSLHSVIGIYKSLPTWWYGACTATGDYLKSNADNLRRFTTAMMQASRWMYSNPGQTISVGTKYTQETVGVVTHAYNFLAKARGWTVNTGLQKDRVLKTMQYEYGLKSIPRIPAYNEVVDISIANSALKKLGVFPRPKKVHGKLVYAKGWF